MYKAVKDVLASNDAIWNGINAFSQSHGTFIQKLDALEQNAYEQSLALIGISAAKDELRQKVVEMTYAISSGIVAYAVMNNDTALLKQINFGRKEIVNASKTNLILLVDRVIAKGSEFENQLSDFGVDQQRIAELQTARDELQEVLNAPRNAIVERKGYTLQIRQLVKQLDLILKMQLDKLMFVLREEHPDFFRAYKDARIIVDHRNRKAGSGGSSNTIDYEE